VSARWKACGEGEVAGVKALIHSLFGEPTDVVIPHDAPIPDPGPGEVRLRLLRSPIHNHDLATIRGVYGYKPKLPAIAGSEFLGVIDSVGSGVTGIEPGMRAACGTRGAWAEFIVVPAAGLVPIPDAIEDDRACQLLAMPLSAIVLFDDLRVESGMWIAQNAAGGAVGRILMQLAQRAGANIVNFVRREDAAGELRGYGAHHVVVTESDGWQERARALTGDAGFARIVDSVAGPQTLELQRLLAHGGELIVFGGLSGAAIKLDPSLMISQEAIVRGFWMTAWMQRATAQQREAVARRVFALALADALPLPVAGVYPLGDAAAALRAAQTPGRGGKVLFAPG
jgi:NADPH:quinone reductase-like Zn-dependent oxidoreductase